MNKSMYLATLFVLLLSCAGLTSAAVPAAEVAGTVEQWVSAERIITLHGKRYQLSESAHITRLGQEKLLGTDVLHVGARVIMEEIQGVVYSLVVLPRRESTMHQSDE
jgi:hypothetical protein